MDRNRSRLLVAVFTGLAMVAVLLWLFAALPARAISFARCVNQTGTGCDAGICHVYCYSSLQDAVDAASVGEKIYIAGGTYTAPPGHLAVITEPTHIIGGYSPDLSSHEPQTYTTILNGQSQGSVLHITDAGEVILEHLTITEGDGTGNSCHGGAGGCGGGIYAISTTVSVDNCTFINNVGSDAGSGKGGGMYLFSAVGSPWTAHVAGSVFEDNIASTDYTGDGGGLWLHTANPTEPATIINNQFQLNAGSNTTSGIGGGVFLHYYASFQENVFHGNAATTVPGAGGSGGGLYMWYAPGVMLDRNRFISNTASGAGGAIQAYSLGAFTMTNNLLVGNHADGKGSGLYIDGQSSNRGMVATLINNTLFNNTGAGGAIYVTRYTTLTLLNNIIANQELGITNTNPANSVINASANLVYNDTDPIVGNNAVLADPLLLPDYHLDSASPAINHGHPTWVMSDYDGDTRPDWCFFDIGFDEYISGLGCRMAYLPLIVKNY